MSHPNDLADQISRQIEGEVRFDAYSKILYSTDASVWQIEPIGAVIPKHHGDVKDLLNICSRHKVPILPRGGATSLSGQTVGEAVHIDFAKYMHGILETNIEEEWVRIQPGVVQDQLGRHLKPYGYMFGPNTSSSSRGTIGGMIGNNSAGSHSILYGKTIDHVLELRCVFADGTDAWLRPLANGELESLGRGDGIPGKLYRDLPGLLELRIADGDGNAVPSGTTGEVVVRGPTVMSGYWRRPEETEASRIAGWHRTGDLGTMDAEGFVMKDGGGTEIYISGGENVYPAEIERVLEAHPQVAEAAVVGRPDPEWGETGHAYVVPLGAELDPAELLEFASQRLARFKLPRSLQFLDELPRTAAGKVRKHVLPTR